MKSIVSCAGLIYLASLSAATYRVVAGDNDRNSVNAPVVLKIEGSIDSLSWHPNSKTIAVQTKTPKGDKKRVFSVQIWDVASRSRLLDLSRTSESKFSVSISPDGEKVAFAVWRRANSSEVQLWSAATGERIGTLLGKPVDGAGLPFTSDLLCIRFSPNGRFLAGCGKLVSNGAVAGQHIGGEVCVWEVGSQKLLWSSRHTHTDIVNSIAFAPDGKTFASGGMDKLIRIWETETGALKRTILGAAWDGIASLTFSADGKLIAAGGAGREDGGMIRVWDVESGNLLHYLKGFRRDTVARVSFHPFEDVLYGVGQSAESPDDDAKWQVHSWNGLSGALARKLSEQDGFSRAIEVSPDGKLIAVGTSTGEVVVFPTVK
jgi:WD40 repeat protein